MKYIYRLIALPFFAAFTLVYYVIIWFEMVSLFVRYGGEWVGYDKNISKESIYSILREGKKVSGL